MIRWCFWCCTTGSLGLRAKCKVFDSPHGVRERYSRGYRYHHLRHPQGDAISVLNNSCVKQTVTTNTVPLGNKGELYKTKPYSKSVIDESVSFLPTYSTTR
ncbi:hypothetical protein F5Y07DRAFT_5958 [Xylaria sp. FL0933]|nr:hypothetical protein F5Y07DRAFT_5958 [Xylaria sp. FL0933]